MSIFDNLVDLIEDAVDEVGDAIGNIIDAANDIFNGNDGAVFLNGAAGNDTLIGGFGNDLFFAGDGNDQLFGESGNDQLSADAGNDIVNGGAGNDIIFGGTGNDALSGEAGRDQLIGGAGNDFLSGGNGDDLLIGIDSFIADFGFARGEIDSFTGGEGRDIFVLGTGSEVFYDALGNSDFALINDFDISQDVIELPANPEPATVTEIGDAGQLLPDAQVIPSGTDSITGTISSNNDVDLFQITLGSGTFSATTVGGAAFNTQLFLFDENGFLVAQNDDSNGTLQSTLPASPTTGTITGTTSGTTPVTTTGGTITINAGTLTLVNGTTTGTTPVTSTGGTIGTITGTPIGGTTTGTVPLDPGTYFLAISSFNNDSVGAPLSGFTGNGYEIGSYTIALTGVQTNPFSLGAPPDGLLPGTAISFENDLIAIVQGVSIPDFNSGFVFV